jgi:hypothetical protein
VAFSVSRPSPVDSGPSFRRSGNSVRFRTRVVVKRASQVEEQGLINSRSRVRVPTGPQNQCIRLAMEGGNYRKNLSKTKLFSSSDIVKRK